MHLIDEAGTIAALRHCNDDIEKQSLHVALARIDEMSFQAPMFVGEVANTTAKVIYTSPHSLEIAVTVTAENLHTGEKRKTNEATVWYVPVESLTLDEVGQTYRKVLRRKLIVPKQMKQLKLDETEKNEGFQRYNQQKQERAQLYQHFKHSPPRNKLQTTLAQWILPDDCNTLGNAQGGVILKLIDNASAIVAVRHTRSNCVTALIDTLDFVRPITLGQLVELDTRIVFTSKKSMQVKCEVFAEDISTNDTFLAVTANLVFVGLDKNNRAIEVEQIERPSSKDYFQRKEYDLAAQRHEARKQDRRLK